MSRVEPKDDRRDAKREADDKKKKD